MTTKKKWTGQRTTKKKRPELVGDSYQADKKNLEKLRSISKAWGRSKAELVRYGVTLVIQVYKALAKGEQEITFDLSSFYED